MTQLFNYTVVMDAAPGPDTSDNGLRLVLVDDPVATQIRESSRIINLSVNDSTVIIEVRCVIGTP